MIDQTIQEKLSPLEYGVKELDSVEIEEELWNRVKNGAVLPSDIFGEQVTFPLVIMYENVAWSIYGKHPVKEGLIKPLKGLRSFQ